MKYIKNVKDNNPVVFNIIKNAFLNNKISHAYLFSANSENTIIDEPMFLIEILISDDPFNEKIRSINSYVDLEIIDNEGKIIRKDQIINAIKKMNNKPFEKDGKKILLIKNIENANKQSLNSLLKFLEDPTPNTFLIFTTNNLTKIIPTIKSRVQIINIKPPLAREIINILITNEGFSKEDAKLFSSFTSNIKFAKKYKNNHFIEIKKELINTFENALNKKEVIYTALFSMLNKDNAILILNLINLFFNDIWKIRHGIETSFNNDVLLRKYADLDFNYKSALNETTDFLKNLNANLNFDLYKNKYLLMLKELYG